MLAQMKGNREVGLYSVALRFSEIWYFIPTIIVSSVMPSLTQAKHDSKERYYILLERLFSLLVKIAYVIALPMTFFSSLLVTSLFGLDYAKSGIILAIHIWSAVFVFLGVGMSPWILNEGFMKYSLFQTFFGLVINIGINLLLIPIYGGIGAAIATLISQMIASFISNAFFPDLRILFKMQAKALVKIN